MSEERRKQARYDSLNLAYLCEDENGSVIHEGMGRTLNVSEGGILLETNFAISPSNVIMTLIALEDDLISLRGKVVHCHEESATTFRTGVEFFKISENEQNILCRFIKLFTEQQSSP
ncbi:MAG: PilZ domain-containing protein [Pseudomonadota bacterium]